MAALRLAHRQPAHGIDRQNPISRPVPRRSVSTRRSAKVPPCTMPKQASARPRLIFMFAEGASCERLAQRMDRAHGFFDCLHGSEHGSRTDIRRTPSVCPSPAGRWISMDALGRERMTSWPSMCDWNLTPCLAPSCARLDEGHDLEAAAESVKIGTWPVHEFVQAARAGRYARRRDAASGDRCCPAGYRRRVSRTLCRHTSPSTVAAVPTGMKAGGADFAARCVWRDAGAGIAVAHQDVEAEALRKTTVIGRVVAPPLADEASP